MKTILSALLRFFKTKEDGKSGPGNVVTSHYQITEVFDFLEVFSVLSIQQHARNITG